MAIERDLASVRDTRLQQRYVYVHLGPVRQHDLDHQGEWGGGREDDDMNNVKTLLEKYLFMN